MMNVPEQLREQKRFALIVPEDDEDFVGEVPRHL